MNEDERKSQSKTEFLHLIIFSVLLFLIFSLFKLKNKNNNITTAKGIQEFYRTGQAYNPEVDKYNIEADYFSKNSLYNSGFAEGLSHWATVRSNNKFSLNYKEYVSPPCSLSVEAKELPCRLYYSKNNKFTVFNELPWNFYYKDVWLGVPAQRLIKVSFYYKGARPMVYINVLKKCGNGKVLLFNVKYEESKDWKKVEASVVMPEYGRAISLEITLNEDQSGRAFLLDDVQIEVSS